MLRTPRHRAPAIVLAVLALAVLVGCSAREPQVKDVADPTGSFHIKVPSTWNAGTTSGVLIVYAGKELPADGRIEGLTMTVYPGQETTDGPLPAYLESLIDRRARSRSWKEYSFTEKAAPTTIGGLPAAACIIQGVDGAGAAFDASVWIVPKGSEAFIVMAVTPKGAYATYRSQVERIMQKDWYWHGSVDATETTTP